jgi:hypothetical protein
MCKERKYFAAPPQKKNCRGARKPPFTSTQLSCHCTTLVLRKGRTFGVGGGLGGGGGGKKTKTIKKNKLPEKKKVDTFIVNFLVHA